MRLCFRGVLGTCDADGTASSVSQEESLPQRGSSKDDFELVESDLCLELDILPAIVRGCLTPDPSRSSSNETNSSLAASGAVGLSLPAEFVFKLSFSLPRRGLGVVTGTYERPSAASASCREDPTSAHMFSAMRMRRRRT